MAVCKLVRSCMLTIISLFLCVDFEIVGMDLAAPTLCEFGLKKTYEFALQHPKIFTIGIGTVALFVAGSYLIWDAVENSKVSTELGILKQNVEDLKSAVGGTEEAVNRVDKKTTEVGDNYKKTEKDFSELAEKITKDTNQHQGHVIDINKKIEQVEQDFNDNTEQLKKAHNDINNIQNLTQQVSDENEERNQETNDKIKSVTEIAISAQDSVTKLDDQLKKINVGNLENKLDEIGQQTDNTKEKLKLVGEDINSLQQNVKDCSADYEEKKKTIEQNLEKLIGESEKKLKDCSQYFNQFVQNIESTMNNNDFDAKRSIEALKKTIDSEKNEFKIFISQYQDSNSKNQQNFNVEFEKFFQRITSLHQALEAMQKTTNDRAENTKKNFDDCLKKIDDVEKGVKDTLDQRKIEFALFLKKTVPTSYESPQNSRSALPYDQQFSKNGDFQKFLLKDRKNSNNRLADSNFS